MQNNGTEIHAVHCGVTAPARKLGMVMRTMRVSLAPLNQLRSGRKRGSDTSDLAELVEKKTRN